MYETQDPNIIFDLRTNEEFRGTKFDDFWDELDVYFNEVRTLTINQCTNIR